MFFFFLWQYLHFLKCLSVVILYYFKIKLWEVILAFINNGLFFLSSCHGVVVLSGVGLAGALSQVRGLLLSSEVATPQL